MNKFNKTSNSLYAQKPMPEQEQKWEKKMPENNRNAINVISSSQKSQIVVRKINKAYIYTKQDQNTELKEKRKEKKNKTLS